MFPLHKTNTATSCPQSLQPRRVSETPLSWSDSHDFLIPVPSDFDLTPRLKPRPAGAEHEIEDGGEGVEEWRSRGIGGLLSRGGST